MQSERNRGKSLAEASWQNDGAENKASVSEQDSDNIC